jgi:hypothetical protein
MENEMTDLTVATTIQAQLGGGRFSAMTGAKNFLATDNSISFKIGSNPKRIQYVEITLNSDDLYDIEFFNMRSGKLDFNTGKFIPPVRKTIEKKNGIFCDNLRRVFTDVTGLYTSLNG